MGFAKSQPVSGEAEISIDPSSFSASMLHEYTATQLKISGMNSHSWTGWAPVTFTKVKVSFRFLCTTQASHLHQVWVLLSSLEYCLWTPVILCEQGNLCFLYMLGTTG